MDTETWATIRRLHEVEKLSKSAVAKRLGIHRWTVRRALGSPAGPPADLPRRPHDTAHVNSPARTQINPPTSSRVDSPLFSSKQE